MKQFFIKSINSLVKMDDYIEEISIEDSANYRNIYFKLLDEIIYSENNNVIDIEKKGLIIRNPLDLNLNEKKLINALYKELNHSLNDVNKLIFNEIESKLMELVDYLSSDFDYSIDYNNEIDINKLFSSIDVRFNEIEFDNYLEMLIQFIKIYNSVLSIKCVVSFGLFSILSKNEIELLKKEIKSMDLTLLNFECKSKTNVKSLIVDSDYCII